MKHTQIPTRTEHPIPPPKISLNRTQKLVHNAAATFARMFLTVGMGLLTTRWTLQALGKPDFGLFAAISSCAFLIVVIQSAIIGSTQRFIAFELGKPQSGDSGPVLATSLMLSCLIGGLLAFTGVLATPALIGSLDIPEGREAAASWTAICTFSAAGLVTAACPFQAVLIAHQRMAVLGITTTFISAGLLGSAALLGVIESDTLEAHATLRGLVVTAGSILTVLLVLILTSRTTSIFGRPSVKVVKPFLVFGFWSVLGAFAWQARTHVVQVATNKLYGPSLNASLSVAQQANGYASSLASAVTLVTTPAIATLEGANDGLASARLRDSTSRISTLLVMTFVCPAAFQATTLIDLWLGSVPPLAADLTIILMGTYLLDQLTIGHGLQIQSRGVLSGYTTAIATITFAQLGLAFSTVWLLNLDLTFALGILLITSPAIMLLRICTCEGMSLRPIRSWAGGVPLRCLPAFAAALVAGGCARRLFEEGLLQTGTVGLATTASIATMGWIYGLGEDERGAIRHTIRKLPQR